MAAWLIVTAVIPDRAAFMACGYSERAAQLVEKAGGKYTIRGPGGQVLEGSGADGSVVLVIEWPSREEALTFWNSPEYAEVKRLREGLADLSVLLVGT